jgi:acetyltransferase-like isoleucine patch superfamily enzyme
MVNKLLRNSPPPIRILAFYLNGLYQQLIGSLYRLKISGNFYIDPTVQIIGCRQTIIGNNSVISEGSWININNRDTKSKTFQLGDNCFVGKNNFFSVGKRIIIRDYCLTAIDCKFVCSTHIYKNPFYPYITTGTTSDDEIYVGVNCFFGVGATVIGNVRIGHGSVIGAGSVIRNDIPPFSIVTGDPGIIIKRYDFLKNEWTNYSAGEDNSYIGEEEYLDILKINSPKILMPLIAASKRRANL